MIALGPAVEEDSNRGGSITTDVFEYAGNVKWKTGDFIRVHKEIKSSGRYNYELCKIAIPTNIRYDRIGKALAGNASDKDLKVLQLLKYGMPIGCSPGFGSKKQQKNHYSALSFKGDTDRYIEDNLQTQALLGPFNHSPISELRFSPMMSVPKEDSKRRVVIDFSFPYGNSINDGISKSSYLGMDMDLFLPSVQSMVSRIYELGPGCLLYKRDLKGAFRQFPTDPGDFVYTGLSLGDAIYIDTRLAMGLRSAAFCCQSVTEMVARIASFKINVFVYFDDFGGAELPDNAYSSFMYLGRLLKEYGLEEAQDKAVAPTSCMDWLGICFDTVEWSIALKAGKREELLIWLPKLLKLKRVNKVLLQKVLGNLVWASAVVRAGTIFFNRLLVLLRKLKRPHHSIHFSAEAKKDVSWWLQTLQQFGGKCTIPSPVWTPLTEFATDASLDGFGMVWGKRAIAGLFPEEFSCLDINCKMLAVMLGIKHWFGELRNCKVEIICDSQVCVAVLNHGPTKSKFLATCLREIQFVLASYNIEIRAKYIPSKCNYIPDLCSRAFSSDVHFNNFNKLLSDRVIELDVLDYEKLNFQYSW